MSCLVMSFHVMSCHVILRHVMSCHVGETLAFLSFPALRFDLRFLTLRPGFFWRCESVHRDALYCK